MNEAGLVVESMMLGDTYYPRSDSRYAIFSLQWIQYQLDNFSSIEEILASDSQIRIRGLGFAGLHFLVCDRRGKIATIEFIQGKLVSHTNETMPVKVLSNNTYADCIKLWKEGIIPQPDRNQSIERFIRAANMVENYDPIMRKTRLTTLLVF
jgi:choloylglycine hydrolase